MKEANAQLKRVIESQGIIDKLTEFDAVHEKHPIFKVTRQYMRMVMEMSEFIRAVRTSY